MKRRKSSCRIKSGLPEGESFPMNKSSYRTWTTAVTGSAREREKKESYTAHCSPPIKVSDLIFKTRIRVLIIYEMTLFDECISNNLLLKNAILSL